MNMNRLFYYCLLAGLLCPGSASFGQSVNKTRTIVTSDGEVDDMDSFIRLLLYSNELNIAGMVYSSSEFHYSGDGKGTTFTSNMPWAKGYGTRTHLRWLDTQWMQDYIDKYAMVYPNLLKHDKNYPSPAALKKLVHIGNIDFEGEMEHNTDGSDFIRRTLLDEDPAPVYIQVWGGTNTIARALRSIEESYKDKKEWKAIYKKVSDKLTLHIILDQDETYKKYVSQHWPDIRVIMNGSQFWTLAYPWKQMVPEPGRSTLDGPWFGEHIKLNHGPLTGAYFCWGDGQKLLADSDHTQGSLDTAIKKGMKQYSFISEGDSPSYLYLINNGLRSFENPSWGGWGGRFEQSANNLRLYQDGSNVTDYNEIDKKQDPAYPQARWVEAMQHDFAARADWCVKEFTNANHPPVVQLVSPKNVAAKAGETITLSVKLSDPDGNALSIKWWQYKEAGSCKMDASIASPEKSITKLLIPADALKGSTIHLIAEVSDNGSPSLTRYARVVITVQ
jgi:hypothetical protein